MKKFAILLLLVSSTVFSQSNNFTIENEKLIWQKINKGNDKQIVAKLSKRLKSENFTNSLKYKDSLFSGNTNQKPLKFIKPPYWASWPFDCFIKIEMKKNRYRITIEDIVFRGPTLNLNTIEDKLNYPLSRNALSKGKIKTSKKVRNIIIELDSFFNEFFTIEKTKEDW